MKIKCDYCGKKLKKPGWLVFSPPDANGQVWKYHGCEKCFANVKDDRMDEGNQKFLDQNIENWNRIWPDGWEYHFCPRYDSWLAHSKAFHG